MVEFAHQEEMGVRHVNLDNFDQRADGWIILAEMADQST